MNKLIMSDSLTLLGVLVITSISTALVVPAIIRSNQVNSETVIVLAVLWVFGMIMFLATIVECWRKKIKGRK